MTSSLTWLDHAVVIVYMLGVVALGLWFSRRQTSDDDYFLGGRRMPWFAVGISVIATLLSSLTYLSEPGEVWQSGITNMLGKMLAIPLEMLLVWAVLLPFMMRFRYTSAYEYLEDRFGGVARLIGVVLFLWLAITWMGCIVLACSNVLHKVTGIPLLQVLITVGVIATLYTVAGGMRAVIWTDVIQVALLMAGTLITMGYIAYSTNTFLHDWIRFAVERPTQGLPLFPTSTDPVTGATRWFDPTVRATVLTVTLSMFCWHVCTHVSNQMVVQRYFSTTDVRAARRSFVTGSLFGVAINLLLASTGLALLYFYRETSLPEGLNLAASPRDADNIFPMFVTHRLPAGLSGAVLAGMLSAAMSSVDSGISAAAAVMSIEWQRWRHGRAGVHAAGANHVRSARVLTLVLGVFVTLSAFALNEVQGDRNLVEMMPRSFNCFIGALGGLFFVAIFMPWCGQASAVAATAIGFAVSVLMAYSRELLGMDPQISFLLVIPGSLSATLLSALLLSPWGRSRPEQRVGLVWNLRHQPPPEPANNR